MSRIADAYETDFHAWALGQAAALRRAAAARVNLDLDLDLEHLSEEIEDLGNSERHAVESHVETAIEHLLTLEFSPAEDPRIDWMVSVRKERVALRRKLTGSLRNHLLATLPERYAEARETAALGLRRDRVPEDALPAECPYSFEQILDAEWWPANRHGLG